MINQLIIMGPPGSGKGTQAACLSRRLEFLHLATGDIIRDNIARKTNFGSQSLACATRGELVPDALVIAMIEEYLTAKPTERIVWDGFPRTIAQAEALDQMLSKYHRQIDLVVALEIPEMVLLERVAGRLTCNNCGRTYHVVKRPPEVKNRCDACGSPLVSRSDDTAEIYKNRLATYHE